MRKHRSSACNNVNKKRLKGEVWETYYTYTAMMSDATMVTAKAQAFDWR